MSEPTRTLVVGVATTRELDPVLPFALELAEARGAELRVVHAFEVPEYLAHACAGPERFAAELEARMCEQAARFPGPEEVVCRAVPGSPAGRLAACAAEAGAELLVVGATRRGRIVRGVLGAVPERVLAESPAPTLVFHEPLFHGVRRVLFATDLSELSAGALARGLEAVETLFGAGEPELRVVFVAEAEPVPGLTPDARALERVARRELERFLARLDTGGRRVSAAVRVGEPAREVDDEARAWRADLLVLGSHGRPGARGPRFGSVAAATVRGAPCNVLVVPARAHVPGGAASFADVELATA